MGERPRPGGSVRARVRVIEDGRATWRQDRLATEEPLEIRLAVAGGPGPSRPLTVTMRTPGHDFELAAGLLFAEGIVARREEIARIAYCVDAALGEEQRYNVVTVELRDPAQVAGALIDRRFAATSACGVCGTATLAGLERRGLAPLPAGPGVALETLSGLPAALRAAQGLFAATGGLHAAGLFAADGRLLAAREDIGRHNAVDKLVGWALLAGKLPDPGAILLVSGRAGYEIAQKAVGAGIPILAAVSAPSSLAVAVAQRFGLTLVGFLRERRANVYAGFERLIEATEAEGGRDG